MRDGDKAEILRDPEAALALPGPRRLGLMLEGAKSGDHWARGVAVRALSRSRSSRAVDALVRALKDRDSSVRFDAIRSLGSVGDARALEPLKKALAAKSNLRHPGLLKFAAEALSCIAARRGGKG